MLVRVYLDPRLASSTSKSAESGNDEAFVVVHCCWHQIIQPQILTNKYWQNSNHHQLMQCLSVASGSSSEERLWQCCSWYKANACICYYINPWLGRTTVGTDIFLCVNVMYKGCKKRGRLNKQTLLSTRNSTRQPLKPVWSTNGVPMQCANVSQWP